jgi:hypothetical protein
VVLGLHSGAKRRTATRTCAAPAAPTPPWRTGSRPCLRGAARARQRRVAGARGRSAFCQAGTDTHKKQAVRANTRAVVVRHLLARRRRVDGRGAVVGEDDALRLRVGGGGVGVLMPTSSVRQLRAARRGEHTHAVSRQPRAADGRRDACASARDQRGKARGAGSRPGGESSTSRKHSAAGHALVQSPRRLRHGARTGGWAGGRWVACDGGGGGTGSGAAERRVDFGQHF